MVGGVVVVGGGHAGTEAAFALRAAGYAGPVTLVCAESGLPYRRPPLSKGYLDGDEDRDELWLRAAVVYEDQDIGLRLGTRAVAIDRARRRVALDRGGELSYDLVVLATGAEALSLPLAAGDVSGVRVLRSVEDADGLRAAMDRARTVVIVGGGFIGLEAAVSARKRGVAVTVLELAPRLMARAVSRELSDFALSHHRALGTDVCLGESLASIDAPGGCLRAVTTSEGVRLSADVLVVGVGVSAQAGLAADAGLVVNDGIVVDECLRTSDPHIFAIGDCARFPTRFAPGPVRLESVQNATDQAAHVAKVIATGADDCYDAVPWFWSHQGSLRIQLAGLTDGHDETLLTGSIAGGRFSVLCFREGVLVGVESVNDVRSHQSARRLLASRAPVTYAEASTPDFDLKDRALAKRAVGR